MNYAFGVLGMRLLHGLGAGVFVLCLFQALSRRYRNTRAYTREDGTTQGKDVVNL